MTETTYRTRKEAIEEARECSGVLEDTKYSSSRYIVRTATRRFYEMPYDFEARNTDTIIGIYRFESGFEKL